LVLGPWQLEARASDQISTSDFLRQRTGGGYGEKQESRTADGTLTRPFGRKLVAKLNTNISLTQFRSHATSAGASPPTPRDSYRQSYRFETLYNQSDRLNSGVALDVALTRAINLPRSRPRTNPTRARIAQSGAGTTACCAGSPRPEQHGAGRLRVLPFAAERNDLSLDFNSVTTLTAVLTPRLTLDVTHNARQQPRGDWRVLTDGSGALLPSDESLNYTLHSRVTWAPRRRCRSASHRVPGQ